MRHKALLSAICLLATLCLSVSAPAQQKRVLGKLGQAMHDVGIHQSMSTRSRVCYQVRAYQYLVVNPTRYSKWTAVMLQDGRQGYIPTESVAKLPYVVTASAPVRSNRSTLTSRSAAGVAGYALNFIGTPYKWGGNDPNSGIDCSGFVKKMFGAIGVNLPRTAAEQAYVGEPVTRLEELRAGDRLYFWEAKRHKVGHTGIYLGNGYFVHSSVGGHGVATSRLTRSWIKILVAARRS